MAKKEKIVDKGMIEDFAKAISNEKARKVFYALSDYIDDCSMEIEEINPIVLSQNVDFFEAGDLLTNTLLSISELDFYLSVKSAQLELNSIGTMQNKFRIFLNKLKAAWKGRKKKTIRQQKKQAKKTMKANAVLTEKQLKEKKEKPYDLSDLKNDVFESLAEKLTNLTVLYNNPNKIRILAKDEFGYRINIYPVIKHDGYFRIWDSQKNKFIDIKPFEAKKLLAQKTNEIDRINRNSLSEITDSDLLFKVIRIFKNLYYNFKQAYNYSFIESLVYSCPNILFKIEEKKDYVYGAFLKVLNYLNNTNLTQIRSIYNDEKTIYQQENISFYSIKSFLKDLQDYVG